MHKIGIISDTHGLLRPAVLDVLQGCEAILHAGDINSAAIIEELEAIAPVYVVRGNADKEWAEEIPASLSFNLFGRNFFMIHNKKHIAAAQAGNAPQTALTVQDAQDMQESPTAKPVQTAGDSPACDYIIFGHSHKYTDQINDGIHWLNPGSCGPRRFHQEITLAIMEIGVDKSLDTIQKIIIPHDDSSKINSSRNKNETSRNKAPARTTSQDSDKDILSDNSKDILPDNLTEIVTGALKAIEQGKSYKYIARKYHIDEDLADTIFRLHYTHPDVGVDGIVERLERIRQ